RSLIGIRIEIEIATGGAKFVLDLLQEVVAVVQERVVVRPHPLYDVQSRVVPRGKGREHAGPRAESAATGGESAVRAVNKPRARASGARTRFALKSSEARAR